MKIYYKTRLYGKLKLKSKNFLKVKKKLLYYTFNVYGQSQPQNFYTHIIKKLKKKN